MTPMEQLVRATAAKAMANAAVNAESYEQELALDARIAAAKALGGSGVPSLEWCSFGDARFLACYGGTKAVLDRVMGWRPHCGSLVLSGPTGAGKTLCAIALARRQILRLREPDLAPSVTRYCERVRFFTAECLVRASREHPLGQGTAPTITMATTASLLVLDELGSEGTDRDGVLFALVNDRYVRGLETIVTTPHDKASLSTRYGDAFVRRLLDRGELIEMGAKS
jgi:DNA replication protein DnaC